MPMPLAAAALLALLAAPVPPRTAPPVRVQRINLDAFGWRHRPVTGPGEGVWTPWTELAVDSRGRVLVGFTVPGPVRLAKRNHPNMRFRVLRFGSSDRPDLSLSIPTRRWQNGVYVDDHDDIIVHADGKLQALVAPPARPGSTGVWKTLAPCGPLCWVHESPNHRMLYVSNPQPYDPKASAANVPKKILLLDRDHPADFRHCSLPSRIPVGGLGFTITDSFAYWNDDPGNPPMPPPVLYRWPLCDYARVRPVPVKAPAAPIGDNLFLHLPTAGQVVIYRADGNVEGRLRLRLGQHEIAAVLASWNGARLAADAITQRGGFPLFDIGTHVTKERLILVAKNGEQLASVPVKPVGGIHAFVFSPDGTRAAVLTWNSSEEVLTIVTVPRRTLSPAPKMRAASARRPARRRP